MIKTNRYFKKEASEIEKQEFFNRLEEYMDDKNEQKYVIEYINVLLNKYPNKYLQESTLLRGGEYQWVTQYLYLLSIQNRKSRS